MSAGGPGTGTRPACPGNRFGSVLTTPARTAESGRDLLPLPRLGRTRDTEHKISSRQRQSDALNGHINEVVETLNTLTGARAGRPLHTERAPATSHAPSGPQHAARCHLGRIIRSHGRPPPRGTRDGILREYLKSADAYSLDRAEPTVPYDATRVRVVREGITPKPLAGLVGPPGREVLSRIRERVLKTEDEISSTPAEEFVQPYSDPHLRGEEGLRGLVDRLLPTGFLTFRRRALAKVGVFTVAKKDGSQRLVFDCRVSNALCRDAPHTELATANALCNLDLSDEAALGQQHPIAEDKAAMVRAANRANGDFTNRRGYEIPEIAKNEP